MLRERAAFCKFMAILHLKKKRLVSRHATRNEIKAQSRCRSFCQAPDAAACVAAASQLCYCLRVCVRAKSFVFWPLSLGCACWWRSSCRRHGCLLLVSLESLSLLLLLLAFVRCLSRRSYFQRCYSYIYSSKLQLLGILCANYSCRRRCPLRLFADALRVLARWLISFMARFRHLSSFTSSNRTVNGTKLTVAVTVTVTVTTSRTLATAVIVLFIFAGLWLVWPINS